MVTLLLLHSSVTTHTWHSLLYHTPKHTCNCKAPISKLGLVYNIKYENTWVDGIKYTNKTTEHFCTTIFNETTVQECDTNYDIVILITVKVMYSYCVAHWHYEIRHTIGI